jgi:hypothetical protein
MSREDCLRDTLAYLDSVRHAYPYGIPRASSETSKHAEPRLLHFLGCFTKKGRAVLDSALEQGLKIPAASTFVTALEWSQMKAEAGAEIFINAALAEKPAQIVVVMGTEARTMLAGAAAVPPDAAGFSLFEGRRYLFTDGLDEVSEDAAVKRRFWNDLKKVRSFLG